MGAKWKRGWKALLLVFPWTLIAAPCANAQPLTEWKLEQKHHVSGVHTFYFTSRAIKVFSNNIGWQIVSKAPDWKVEAFRSDDKVKCTMTRQAFYLNRGFRAKKNRLENLTLIGTHTVGPVKTNVYSSRSYQVWVGRLKGIPVEVEDMIIAYHEGRPVDGLMLKGMTYAVDGPEKKDTSIFSMNNRGAVVTVETLSLKQIPYKASDFAVPLGLREVHDMEKIMTSDARRKEAEAMLEEMGVGEKLGSPKSRQSK